MLETLDDIREIMDRLELRGGIEAFFSCLPSPEEFDNYVKEHGHSDDEALYRATFSSGFRASGKNDVHKYLLARLPRNPKDMVKYWDSLAHLSTKKETISLEGESAMAVQLRFLNWVVRGRNEAEKDLVTTGTTTCTDTQRRTAVRLPKEANRACAACHKKPAESSSFSCCAGCAIESDCGTYNVSCTYYCGLACQKEHWATHKVFCNPRRKVIRAAWLLQELMKFVEAAGSYTPWEGLGVEDGITYLKPVHQGSLHFMGAADVHVVLPALKEVNAQASAAWIAALNANNCIEVVHVGRQLLDLLIKPFCKKIDAVTVYPRNAANPVCTLQEADPECPNNFSMFKPHIVLRLTLTSGEQMALDVTCGQFGWRVPIAPWEKWRSHRAMPADREKVTRLDVIAQQEVDLRLERDGPEYVARDNSRREMVAGMVDVIMREAKSRGLDGVTDILKLPTADYKKAEDDISNAALNRCLAVTEAIHKAGVRRWYFDQTPVQRLARSPEEVKALQGVWLSQELINECKDDEKKLQKLYMLRCMRKDKKTVFKKLGMKMDFTQLQKKMSSTKSS